MFVIEEKRLYNSIVDNLGDNDNVDRFVKKKKLLVPMSGDFQLHPGGFEFLLFQVHDEKIVYNADKNTDENTKEEKTETSMYMIYVKGTRIVDPVPSL